MDMKNEDMKNAGHPEGCRCLMCQGGKCDICGEKHCPYHGFGYGYGCGWGYHRHWLIKIVVAIAIACGIFWIGFRFGSFMSYGGFGYGPGYRMMQWNSQGGYYPMMGYGYWRNSSEPNATSSAQ